MGKGFENLTALALAAAIRSGEFGAEEVARSYIRRAKNGAAHNAFLALAEDRAMRRAAEIQAKIKAGESLSPLAGVPVAVKDNISTEGIETSCASKMLEGYVPVFSATAVERLEKAGMIVVGKLNMDEFAMGGSSETGAAGPVLNPWDTSRVAGGSSGGSAAAVAAGEIPLSLGTDTGGSIRQPCSFCGVTGIKPTYGAVSRWGLVAYASSLDQIGPVGLDIEDCAALLSVISGPDEKDPTCVIKKPFDFASASGGLEGVKIGLPSSYFQGGIEEDVKTAVLGAAKEFQEAGAAVEEFEMPLADWAVHAYYIIACAEASSNLARYDGLKFGYRDRQAGGLSEVYRRTRSGGFGLEIKRRIMLGSFVLSSGYYDAYYKKALQARALIKKQYDGVFSRFDMVLSPVAPTGPYKIGENIDDPLKMYMGDIYTVPVNLAGLPAAALPCGFDRRGMPVGFQLIACAFAEGTLVRAARAYQSRTGHHAKRPKGGGAR